MEIVKKSHLILAAIFSIAFISCGKSQANWNGRWALNKTRSSLPKAAVVISKLSSGQFNIDNGTYVFTFKCDGKEYPTPLNRAISCIHFGDDQLKLTSIENNAIVKTALWKLSQDRKTLTIETTIFHGTKSDSPTVSSYSRRNGSADGFDGSWGPSETRPQVILLNLDESELHFEIPGTGQHINLPLNGSEAIVSGPSVPSALTMKIIGKGPREFQTVTMFQGKDISMGSLTISPDGRSISEESWRREKPEEKELLFYERH
jgi:hypothetical protein